MDLTGRRLRLLFIVPFTPHLDGRHGGARVTAHLIANLAARHDVALVHLASPGERPVEDEVSRLCGRVERVEQTQRIGRARSKLALLRGIPTWASEVADARFAARVQEVTLQWDPQIVQIEYPVAGRYLPALKGCSAPRVMTDHEGSVRDLREWQGPLASVTRALDDRAWRVFERRVMQQVEAVIVFTDRDRRTLDALGSGTRVVVVPFGVAVPASALAAAGAPPPAILFVGNFMHPANADAALWLAGTIFPLVRAQRPDARLTIVGPNPPAEIRALARDGVVVTGEVPEVTPYLDEAAVVAAPIRVGGGMRVKVMEALAAGKAVVATPLAVEGLDLTSGEQLEVAVGAEDFSLALTRLLDDEQARRALATRARSWASGQLSWAASVERHEALYDSLIAAGRPA